ncbi:hypothetical protein GGI15_001674 [Coemansia interrupta]|uniref:Uncharacterized protein n=1 Tax=Coemansia interrupta TaxID=1126814 RepID=A0A9W8HPL9_9FUNG|nr:hypothetical protein GGI15_001674 [Coemansia interrupta]
MAQQRQQPEDPTAHEIIVLSPKYHLSVHFPQGSLYADVWLGINTGTSDLLVHISELRRQALNTSPASEASDSTPAQQESPDPTSTAPLARKDSGCARPTNLAVRQSDYGLFNCPDGRRPLDWLVAKESLVQAESICASHHGKFVRTVDKVQKLNREQIPSLDPLTRLLDEMRSKNERYAGPIDQPACCICKASPYTRLFFSML